MDNEQERLVRETWSKLIPHSDRVGELFYTRLFELNPSLRPLFKGGMEEQGRRLMTMLGAAITEIDRLDALHGELHALGARHAHYGVKEEDYQTFQAALMWTLQRVLGAELTPDAEEAWCVFYQELARAMQS